MKNNIKPHRSNRVKRKKNPAGGLTEEGRRYFRKTEGAHLQPGVKTITSAEDLRRKGSFLRRFYGRKKISPLQDQQGRPTRFAKAAHAWGEPVPKDLAAVKRLAKKGERLLERYRKRQKNRVVLNVIHNPSRLSYPFVLISQRLPTILYRFETTV